MNVMLNVDCLEQIVLIGGSSYGGHAITGKN